MSPTPDSTLSPRKLIMQLIGFAIGLAMLIWCIRTALKGGDWERLRHANPWLVAGLAGCSLASLLVNGAVFWLVIRPTHPLRLVHLELLNLATSVLNYAPIRLGLIARVAYHVRVDRMSLLLIGGWLAAIGYTLVLTMGAVMVITLMREKYEWSWPVWAIVLTIALAACGGLTIAAINSAQAILGIEFVERVGKGMHKMLRQPAALWGAIGLRVVDIAAFTGRMACAAAILGLSLNASEIVLLAVTALAMSLFPLGRVGYREAGVAFFAQFLGMSGAEFDAARNQLALVESAGEAIVAVPLGAMALLWYRSRWIKAGRKAAQSAIDAPSSPEPESLRDPDG
jgi:hypothetical protein